MGLLDFISNTEETRENHPRREFKTRYFRCGYTKTKEAIIKYAEANDIGVRDINDTHGEIYLQTRAYHMMISIIQVTPLESAVDVKVQSYRPIGFFKPRKLITALYEELKDKLQFKGAGLHP
jgi:hypothetical protein